ncbi:hypothetical protein [Sphingobium sp. CCH11-B1]|uniref:hypothetical protein n=1 Tax=Sphingobium sp. CCH11-B1 TaxID=1768781 RepID=UPI001E2E3330|nr:hypothetical protein [Sphingobium sp. CCH11-B1]
MTWLLHEVGNEGLGRDLALHLGPMMNELFAGLAVPSVEQYRQSWIPLGKHLTSTGRLDDGLRAVTAADIDACDVLGQYSRFRCLVYGLRAIDERNPDLLRPELKARINFTSRHNGKALRPREPLTPFVARVLKEAVDRQVIAARDRIVAGREQIEALRKRPDRNRFEDVFLRVADGARAARGEFDLFKYRKVAISAASDLLVLTLPDAIYLIIAIALRVEMPIEGLRTLRRDCLKNPARGYVSIEYTKGRGGVRGKKIKRERVRDGGINTPGGLIRLALELSRPAAERMVQRDDPDADYLWIGFVAAGLPSWRRFRLCTQNFYAAVRSLDLVDEAGREITKVVPARLRKTVKRDNYLRHAGHLRRFASDHSRGVAARHYAAVDGLREEHARSVEVAETQLFDMAMAPLVLPPAKEADALSSGLTIRDQKLASDAVASLVSGEADTFLGICTDFWSSPMGRSDDGSCATAFAGCLHCSNAVFTARKLPALLDYVAWLAERRAVMAEVEWRDQHGADHDRITAQILPMFEANDIEQAKSVDVSNAGAPPLPPHLRRG